MQCLQANEVLTEMNKLNSSWKFNLNVIEREFVFKDFKNAFSFMTTVAAIAERLNHPEWTNIYNTVIIKLNTHELGCLTELDFTFAQEIDVLI